SGVIQKNASEVSTSTNSTLSAFSLHPDDNTLRKRFTTSSLSPKLSPTHAVSYSNKKSGILLHELKKQKSDSDYNESGLIQKKKAYPFKNRSAEDCASTNNSNLYKRALSKESFDVKMESDFVSYKKYINYKDEEKSHLICLKDSSKILTVKNDTKLTKYNTFTIKCDKKNNRLTKYRSLDSPEAKTIVRYIDPQSKVSIAANDFDAEFKMSKFGKHRHKHDIIVDTVDAWSKKNGKNMFTNIRNSLFKSNSDKEIVYKPLIFGGTFPIDLPMKQDAKTDKTNTGNKSPLNMTPKVREYGPAKTFDIDQPI
ncbi:hypothetical protein HHI36_016198, partial [Cryptolaemus montrouzieri]